MSENAYSYSEASKNKNDAFKIGLKISNKLKKERAKK